MKTNKTELLVIEAFKSSGYLIVNKTAIKNLGLLPAIILGNYIDKYIYFKKQYPENDGWFFLTHEQIGNQLNLKEHSIVKNKQFLIKKGILKIDKKGIPAKEWLKIDFETLATLMTDNEKGNEEELLEGQDPLFSGGQGPLFSGGLSKDNKDKKNKGKEELNYIVEAHASTNIERNKPYKHIASFLGKLIMSKKRINITAHKINNWANSVRQLVELDGVSVERVEKALKWYEVHFMDDYVPVIESGGSLRDKFMKLESAIERSQKPVRSGRKSGYKNGTLQYKRAIKVDEQ